MNFRFNFSAIEEAVEEGEGLYKDHQPEALYTSAEDLNAIQKHPLIQGTWVDLGAGVGLSALMYGEFFPDRRAVGIEFSLPRFRAGEAERQRHNLSNVELICGNLLSDPIPRGDTYFLYFPTGMVLDRILDELSRMPRGIRLVAIESHGDLLGRLKQEPWLEKIAEIPLVSPRHYPKAMVFESVDPVNSKEQLFTLSFLPRHLVVREESQVWLGESYGLTWLGGDRFNLLYPPRTIHSHAVERVLDASLMNETLRFLVSLRRKGTLTILAGKVTLVGEIRKIMLSPVFSVEFSTGERVEWQEITSILWESQLCYESSSQHFFLPPAP